MDRGACGAPVHGITKSLTRLSDFDFSLLHAISQGLSVVAKSTTT